MVLCDQMLSDLFLNLIFWKLINSIFQAIPVLTLHTQNKQREISKWILTLCVISMSLLHLQAHFHLSSLHFSQSVSSVITLPLLVIHSPILSHPLQSHIPPSMLALTHYELLAALMYGQYSLYHISTAEVCKGRDRKRRREGKEREREKRWGGDTFVLLISALKDTITSHSILSMFYTIPGPHAFALPRSPHVRPIF